MLFWRDKLNREAQSIFHIGSEFSSQSLHAIRDKETFELFLKLTVMTFGLDTRNPVLTVDEFIQ